MILISIARSSGAANKVPDILRNCLEKDKHVEVALPFRSSTVHSRSGGSYYLQFHKFSSIEDANMALTTLQSGLSIVPMVEIANTFPFPSLTKNDPGMFETNKSKKTFCSQYYNGNCKTPNCRFSHHPEVAFRAELNEPTASAIWSRDIRCGTWALKYGRTYPNNTDKGLQLFSKLLCLEAGKELQRANKLLASAIVDFRQCEALKNQYELDVHREEEIERSMEAPALPVPTTCALAAPNSFPAAASAPDLHEAHSDAAMPVYTSLCVEYLQRAANALQRGDLPVPQCQCRRGGDGVMFCRTCDKHLCVPCGAAHTVPFDRLAHNVCAFCPRCSQYQYLFSCAQCQAAGDQEDGLLCSDCHSDQHRERKSILHDDEPDLEQWTHQNFSRKRSPGAASAVSTGAAAMTVVLTAPAVSVPASAVAAHSTARVSPPLLGAADIDEDRLRMIDCRAAIEEVAHPVVIDYFKQRWSLTAHICGGCSKLHPFSGIQKSCLLYLVRSLYSYNSAVQGVQRLSAKISNIEQCLQDQFDLGALCNIVRDFDEEFSGPADVDSHLSCLTKCRGNCYHKSVIDEPERKQLFLDVERACSAITLSVQKWSKWSVQSIKDKLTAIPNHHGDAMRKFKDQILRESKRSTDEKVLHLLSASFAVDVGRRSRQIADLLCSDKHFKFLVIPPLAQGAAKTGDRTIRSDYQNQLRFLLDVPWTAVLDFNQLWFADHSDMSTLDQDALGSRLEVTTSLRATELSTYGKSCTLYTSLPSELVKLRDHNQDMHCYIVLVGFGDLDCSRSATSSLQSSLISITSALFVNERNWSLVPIITDAISANSSPMAAVLDMAKEENEKDEGSDTSEYKRFASFLCDVEFIESFISGRVRNNLNVLLPAAEKFHYRVGYPAKALQKFSDCLEVLTCDCDERALHVTPDEVQGLEENFSAAQVKQEILALELKRFLCGGKRTSWLLLKEGKIVRRSIVDSIIEAIVSKDFQSITLQHCIGTGATTVARNVLYELRHKFLCVVISNSSGEFSKISELLRTLQNKAALPLLVLLDLNASQDRLYNIRSQLVREDVTFLCTAFFEKGRKFQKANSAAGASTDVGSKSYDKGEAEFELPFELLPGDEQVQLSKLMVTSKQVVLDGVPIDSTFFTPLGHLDVDRVLKLDVLKNSLLSKSNEYLLNIGLCPIDVVYLRNSRFYSSRDTTSVYAKQRREIMLSPLFYGLFALDKDYARRASLYALKILERMENAEIQVIKLCCLYALFAPTEKLHNKLASYIYHGNTMRSDAVDWSVAMRQLVAFDCTSPGFMSIKVLPLSYVLARSPHIFGEEREWHSTVPNYLLETLFVLLEQSSYQLDLLNMLESGFLQAFVEFKIWHPERTRPIFFNGKRLRYSFLLEYILFYTAKQSGGELVRGIMNRLRLLYRNFPSHTIATHTARFLTNLAHSEQLFKYLLEAERILLEREEGLNYATVCDRLGHVYKTHVRIISKLISEGKLTLQFTAVAEPVCSPTGGYLAQRPYHNYSDMAAVSFDTVCEIAMEADRWFVKAMKIARYSVPNPMIGAVQVWTKVLAIIKFSLCSDREDRFRQYYSGPHQHELQPGVFQRIRDLDVFEYCNDRLHSARNALKYKKKLGEKDGNIDRDFFAVHGQESTKEMIWELWTTINKYINVTTPVRKFSGYNRVLAKHWMAVKNNHELSCDKLVFCMLSFADAMFPVDVVSKRSKKSAKSPPIPHSAQQKAIQASDDALLHATAVELFFQASCMLTKFSADEVCDAVEFFSKFRLDLVSHLRPITLEPQLSRWIDHVKAGDSFGLSARVSKLALIIWQILLNGDLNAFDALKKCMRELEVDSEQYQFTNKSRLFLARANSAPCNPFTAYYFAEDLPFKDKLAGPYRDHEPVYACAESYDCLFVCEGVLKQTERGRFVVECAQLQLDDIFMFSDNADPSLADNYQVTFVLALRDGGLVAHGVRVKPSK